MAVEKANFSVFLTKTVEFLKTQKVCEYELFAQELKTLDSSITPVQGVEQLLNWNIRTAPVVNYETNAHVGVLDLRDCVNYVITQKQQSLEENTDHLIRIARHPRITNRQLSYLARMRSLATLPMEGTTFFDCLGPLSSGHHFLAFTDENNNFVGFCTQRQLYSQISDQVISFAEGLNMEHLQKHISSPARFINGNKKAFEAFEILSKTNVGALAIVDESGHLLSCTSGRDVKSWLTQLQFETMTIQELLDEIVKLRKSSQKELTTSLLTNSLRQALGDLKEREDERIWILQPDGTLHGVFSLSDFFRVFL